MGVTWETDEATRMRRTARTLWGFGIGASVLGMVAGLTFCRPPAPPASVGGAERIVIAPTEDSCPADDVIWHLASYEAHVCLFVSR